jgi:lipopolysaccharide/colanic/teichoic acid biosynthesis glycosyltransferase
MALTAMVLLLPILFIIALMIKIDSQGGILFKQTRVGRYGKLFKINKFRTMRENTQQHGRLTVGKDQRITKVGFVLRKYKLDELPQLFDVLIGSMSIVGPRPEVPEFMETYPQSVRTKVLSVKPGITDLASIAMIDENEILSQYDDAKKAYIEKVLPVKQKYYLEYVEKKSMLLDIKIIMLTLVKIVRR